MAGFVLRNLSPEKSTGLLGAIQKNIVKISSLGMKWDDKIIKNSKSIGVNEVPLDSAFGLYNGGNYGNYDYGQKEFIAFFDREYATRREFLRRFSQNSIIEHAIEIIADETVVYDESNFFAYPATKSLKGVLKAEKAKDIVDDLNEAYKKIYYAFKFNENHDAWNYVKQFLTDGFLAFEIIYDEDESGNAVNVIGFKELDPITLEPEIRLDEDGNEYRVWIQFRGDAQRQRTLVDGNVIYISWARGNFISRLSYSERLVRSFNMLRTLENSRLIWNVWNSQYRMKIVVPVGSQSEAKIRTRLSELRAVFKEDLNIDYNSGEVTFNGQPNFSFFKTFLIPSGTNGSVDINSFAATGYDLNNTEQLKYFLMRFINETNIPVTRFNLSGDQGGNKETWGAGAENAFREEISFSNFISRIRAIIKEIVLKPMWIQFCLMHPEFQKDKSLKGAIGLDFYEDNIFRRIKEREIAEKAATTISTLYNIKMPTVLPDGTQGEESYFDMKFLVEKYMELNDFDIKLNETYKKESRLEIKKMSDSYKRLAALGETPGAAGAADGSEPTEFGGKEEANAPTEELPTETPQETSIPGPEETPA